jgi:hypothetical protein
MWYPAAQLQYYHLNVALHSHDHVLMPIDIKPAQVNIIKRILQQKIQTQLLCR